MANSKTDEQETEVMEPVVEAPVGPVVDKSVEGSNSNSRSYFFPNDGQAFSCDAASLEEAEKKNTQYLQQLKGDK